MLRIISNPKDYIEPTEKKIARSANEKPHVRLFAELDVVLLLLFTTLAASGLVTASRIDKKDETDNVGTTKQWTIETSGKIMLKPFLFSAILIYSSSFLCSRLSSVETTTLLTTRFLVSFEIFLQPYVQLDLNRTSRVVRLQF